MRKGTLLRRAALFSELKEGDSGYDFAPDAGYKYDGALPPSSWSLDSFDGQNFFGPTYADPTTSMDGDYWLAAANSQSLDCMMDSGEDAFDCVSEPDQV
jgi:hypothetical protein